MSTRLKANDYDCTLDKGELGYLDLLGDPRWLFATGGSSYAPLWSHWYEGGEPKEAPPEAMQRQMHDLPRAGRRPADTEGPVRRRSRRSSRSPATSSGRWGSACPVEPFCIKSNRMHNVPGDDQMWLSFKCPYPGGDQHDPVLPPVTRCR